MKYRTQKELASLSLGEVLSELDMLKIEPEGKAVYPADVFDKQGVVSASGEPPAYLMEAQKRECRETGTTMLTLQQQVEQVTSLDLWRTQLYQHGVSAYVASLGLAKCMAQLKARKAELSTWDQRMASRRDVEKKLIQAIQAEEQEEA